MQPSCLLRGASLARRWVICLTGVLAVGASYSHAAEAEKGIPSSIAVHVERGLLSVDARNAPLDDLLVAIANQADFRLVTKGNLDTPVTWSFVDVPVDEAVQRLLWNVSSVMNYAAPGDGGTARLVTVHTLRRKVNRADNDLQVTRTIPTPPTNQATKAMGLRPQPALSLDDDREDKLQPVRRLIEKPNATSVKDLALLVSQDRGPVIRGIADFSLSHDRLGGVTDTSLARNGLSDHSARSSIAIRLIEDSAGPAVANGAVAPIALENGHRLALTAPGPVEPAEAPDGDRREALGAALAALSDDSLDAPAAASDTDPLTEAAEAALAHLYEEPLETAAAPPPDAAEALEVGALQQAALPVPTLPDLDTGTLPAWQRFAVPIAGSGLRPMIAVVLDDLGLNRSGTRRAIALPGPLTLSFMTYAEGLERMAAAARDAGHELMLHVPMEPRDKSYEPGPNVLSAHLSAEELMRRLEWGLERFRGFVGINNHMGSRFTASPGGMAYVMRTLKARGLLFLDSLTAPSSVGAAMARRAGVPYALREVFLDNAWHDRDEIARQLARLEAVARQRGSAVGIGHPHRATLDVLARWLPEARARGFAIVPISAIVRHRLGIRQQFVETPG